MDQLVGSVMRNATEMRNAEWWSGSKIITVGLIAMTTLVILGNLLTSSWQKKQNLPPGPKPLPIIGNMHQLGKLPHRSSFEFAKTYGPIMLIRIGQNPCVIVSSAEAAQEFTKEQDKSWCTRPTSMSAKVFTNYKDIIWAPYGSHWRHLRKICTLELFTQKRIDSFRPRRTDELDAMVRNLYLSAKDGQAVKLIPFLTHFAVNNITRMMLTKRFFGANAEGQEGSNRFKEAFVAIFEVQSSQILGDAIPWLKWVTYVSGFYAYMKKVKFNLDEFLQEFLDLKKVVAVENYEAAESKVEDFVDVLLAQPNETGTGNLDDDSIKGVVQDMLLAGSDSSSNTVEWAIAELIRHPEIMKRLQAEIDRVVGKERTVSETDIQDMPYLQAVVKEVFRLYPPAPMSIPHQSTEPTKVWGYDIPSGTRMFMNVYAMQRDERFWPNPHTFDPDRFIRHPEIDMKGTHYQFLPFGAGRRKCPGTLLGILFVQVGVARLVHSFDISLPNGQDPATLDLEEKFAGTMPRANPLVTLAKPRLPAHLY